MTRDTDEFERFAAEVRPRLIRAFVPSRGLDGAADAAAEALAHGFEHWEKVREMQNPAGWLYRVGQSRTRVRKVPLLPPPESVGVPDIEPQLVPALAALPETQRTAVWLVHACEWTYAETAEALGTSVSMVGNHVSRALKQLRDHLEVDTRA